MPTFFIVLLVLVVLMLGLWAFTVWMERCDEEEERERVKPREWRSPGRE